MPQSTTSVSLLNQGPVFASREFNLCNIGDHPAYLAVREHSYSVNGDRRYTSDLILGIHDITVLTKTIAYEILHFWSYVVLYMLLQGVQ